jgi:hypothetical protein
MPVDPLKSRALILSDAGKAAGQPARRSDPAAERSADVPAGGDTVELSAASRGMVDRAEEASEVPHGTLSAERMHTILRRLTDGYYDKAEVRGELARRLRHDVANSRPE